MAYEVVLTKDAERDLEDIFRYIAESDSPEKAEYVLERLLQAMEALGALSDRGSRPKELRFLGDSEYRQTFFKPYRMIYRVHEEQVVVYVIAAGRRDMQSLLMRRLLHV